MRMIRYNEFFNGYILSDKPDNHPHGVRDVSYNDGEYSNIKTNLTLSQIFSELNNLKNNLGFEKKKTDDLNIISFNLHNNDIEVIRFLVKNKLRYAIKINGEFCDEDESQIGRLFRILVLI